MSVDTIKLQGKDYAPVKERIKAIHEKEKNVSINTELTWHRNEKNVGVQFKAIVVVKNEQGEKTFSAHSFKVYKNDKDLEKAETIAVGRALAYAGYLVSGEIASHEEMEDFTHEE